MQESRFFKVFSVLLVLVCVYQLSFTWQAKRVETEAEEYSQGDKQKELHYLDSVSSISVYNIGIAEFTYDEIKNNELNLGLDLKGGINVILEISQKDILVSLTKNSTNSIFLQALEATDAQSLNSQNNYVDNFFSNFDRINEEGRGSAKLADYDIFGGGVLKTKISPNSPDELVRKYISVECSSAVNLAYNVLRSRIDRFGVAQPNIQKLENSGRILIELPGVKDTERVKKLLQSTAKLEFWETYNIDEVFPFFEAINQKMAAEKSALKDKDKSTEEEKSKSDEVEGETKEEKTDKEDTVKKLDISDLLAQVDSAKTTEDGQTTEQDLNQAELQPFYSLIAKGPLSSGPVVGYVSEGDKDKVLTLIEQNRSLLPNNLKFAKFVWTSKSLPNSNIYQLIAIKSNRKSIAPLDGSAIAFAKRDFDQLGSPSVSMSMNRDGSIEWSKLTGENIGKSVAIVLDGNAYSFPVVNDQITGGNSQISGDFTIEEAEDLANVLNAGKLPAPAKIIQAEIVGPSLGKESIKSGMISFVISFLVILAWLMFYYTRSGLFGGVALIINVLMIFGVLASFGATLTLPGIAGIVLTIGMAVDANVIIFERIKEELTKGKSIQSAISDGYKGSYSSILDANLTTLLTSIVLLVFGMGPIRGFATTLIVGIFTSLFSAIFVTRYFVNMRLKKGKSVSFFSGITKNWLRDLNIPFTKYKKVGYVISSILIVVSIYSLTSKGLNKGVDFVGGRSYIISYEKDIVTADMSAKLAQKFVAEDGTTTIPEVKTFGSVNKVKITTKYKINEVSDEVDIEILNKIYQSTKLYLPDGMTFSDFEKGEEKYGLKQSLKVGPSIADDITQGAFYAVFISLAIVFMYLLVRFSRWQFSAGAVIAVFHDVLITIGLFSLLDGILPFSLEIDQSFIAAILTVIGYSLNDTVIVFDRIREYFAQFGNNAKFGETVNRAINTTLSRTINTSLTTILVILTIFLFGSDAIKGFLFALLIGVAVGTYSSTFVASFLTLDFWKKGETKTKG